MYIRFTLFIVLIFSLGGCASRLGKYGGQKPNLSLTGSEAKEEFSRFQLEEDNFWVCGSPCFTSDPSRREHSWESTLPLIESVSPRAAEVYKKTEIWRKVQLYSLGVGITGLVLGLSTRNDERDAFLAASLAGSIISIGSNIYVGWHRSDIPEIYNEDLKIKLSPTVGMRLSY